MAGIIQCDNVTGCMCECCTVMLQSHSSVTSKQRGGSGSRDEVVA